MTVEVADAAAVVAVVSVVTDAVVVFVGHLTDAPVITTCT